MTQSSPITRPAAFLDRDGTMIVDKDYLGDPDGVELIDGVAEAIHRLNEWGFWVFGVSNQSGVARGYFNSEHVDAVNARVIEVLADRKAYINRIYYCPHYSDDGALVCDCRKPRPGLIHQAMHDYPIDLSRSFIVGDRQSDVELAHAVGIPGALVLTGYGRRQQGALPESVLPEVIGENLYAVVQRFGERLGLIAEDNL